MGIQRSTICFSKHTFKLALSWHQIIVVKGIDDINIVTTAIKILKIYIRSNAISQIHV